MKKLFLTLIILLLSSVLYAQVPTPFLANGQQKCLGSTVIYGPAIINPAYIYTYSILPAQTFTPIFGGTQIQVLWNVAGVYNISITATDANGCTSTSVSTVTIVPAVTITVTNQVVCQGSSAFALISNQAGVTWSGTGVVGNNFNPAGLAPGVYPVTATFTDANGCTGTGTGNITITPTPATPILNSDN